MTSTQTPAKIEHTIHLFPPDTTLDEQEQIASMLHSTRSTFTYSADAAHAIVHAGTLDSRVVIWSGERWVSGDIFAWFKEKGVNTQSREFDGSTPAQPGHDFGSTPRPIADPLTIQHTIHLLPQNTTLAELKVIIADLHPTKSAFTYSADAAHALVHAGDNLSKVVVWGGERWSGDIFAWLDERGITFTSERIDPIGGTKFIFTDWPTEHKNIMQIFNVNPQNYPQPGLTGHDGLDITAPLGSKIFAAAAGTVYKMRDVNEGHNYGTVIYIRHEDGYRSAYAHLQSIASGIAVNSKVVGGQLLGRSDSTGNVWPKDDPVAASHLHLTLYHDGASARGETPMDFDIIDPLPYLQHLLDDDGDGDGSGGEMWGPPAEPVISGWGFASSLTVRGVLAKVTSNRFINFRAGPGTDHDYIGRVFNDTIVKVTGPEQNGYLPILASETDVDRARIELEVGLHNENGAEWMLQNGLKGWALQTVAVGTDTIPIDATRFEEAGIKLLVRLNYGYGSTGNIPRDDDPNYEAFIQACIDTITLSLGVWGFIFGNETNNGNEFPGNNNGQGGEPILPERYAKIYNRIWNRIPVDARFGPQAVDPYYDPQFIFNIDSRDYWTRILNNIGEADFLTIHPKTQDSNPDSVDSDRTFGPGPLSWQFFHLKAYQPLLDAVPARFRALPVIATEVNPQMHNDGQTLGWQTDQGPAWVRRAVAHFKQYNQTAAMPVTGLIFYRFSTDQWRLDNKPSILQAIKQEI